LDDLTQFSQAAWQMPWIRALAIVLAAVVLAKAVDFVICRVLGRLTSLTTSDLDDQLIELLHRPIFASVLLIGLHTAVSTVEPSETVLNVSSALIKTLAILFWTGAGFKLVSTTLSGLSRLADRVAWLDTQTLPLFDNMAKITVFGLATYGLLLTWDLDLAPWLASAGIAGIAIGFAAKDSLANLFGGFFVIMDAPYKLGDIINLDSGERGEVVKIGLRSTRLLTRDDVEITLPNAHIANSKIVNESGGPYEKTRVVIEVGVAYGSDIQQVREVLQRAAESVEHVVSDPAPRVRFSLMGDSALIFRIQGWIDSPAYRSAAVDGMNTAVYNALGEAGIEIPFPQRVVTMVPPAQAAES
jgi:small-conductance mechanosensitive channel